MGQEIHDAQFSDEAFAEFSQRVGEETALLAEWERAGLLQEAEPLLGYELEGWLVDAQGLPAARNAEFIAQANDPEIVPELASFNFEINDQPLTIGPGQFERMRASLLARWQRCEQSAAALDMRALSIGILPTVGQRDLCLGNISQLSRYHALNEQVFRLRNGQPILLDIAGHEHLQAAHDDVMLEAATTSLQIHMQLGSAQMVRAFNAAKMLSAPMVAIGANAPFFLGHRLWMESRIPVFEQAVSVGGSDYSKRVTFGVRYAQNSILECFAANRDRYPVLLPDLMDEPPESLAHLRLHNGTIWRWNRPLVGFDAGGAPHYRLEHRVVAAGTSAVDVIADTAFFVGCMRAMLDEPETLEQELPFSVAQHNFYAAAKAGLQAQVAWRQAPSLSVQQLIEQQLLPMAEHGLRAYGLEVDECQHWLAIIAQRVGGLRTGADWQLDWVARYGRDWPGLVSAYAEQQDASRPVHEWVL